MASPAPTEQAALKVFGIPELAYLICANIHKRDNVSLIRVCRQLFYYMLPFVWEEVDEANALVSLIPGGGIVTYESDVSPYMVMHLPRTLELSRLNIYAPYVKRLTPSALYIDEYDGWDMFLSCTRPLNLLPNLETLNLPIEDNTWDTPTFGKIDVDSVNWVIAFLSNSLRTLVLVPPGAIHSASHTRWLDFDLTNRLMELVSQKSPALCSLHILPKQLRASSRRYGPAPQISFENNLPELPLNVPHLRNLSFLLVSQAFLSPSALVALSGLPKLKTLSVLGWRDGPEVRCDNMLIPAEAFPSLKNLELYRLTWNTVANMCNTKALVAKLHSMTISYPRPSDGADSTCLSDIIPILATNNSSVTTLVLRDIGDCPAPPEVLKSWRRLPLINLHLGWTRSSTLSNGGYDRLYSILSCLPLLEDLRLSMYQEPFDLKQMRKIIDLSPHLRRIWIPVKWASITQLTTADFAPCQSQSEHMLCIKSNFYLPKDRETAAKRLARYLSNLRPMAPVICEAFEASFYRYDTINFEYVDEQPKDMINVELSRLRLAMD